MQEEAKSLTLRIEGDFEVDQEELAVLTTRLRELLQLDVEEVDIPRAEGEPGARAVDSATMGMMLPIKLGPKAVGGVVGDVSAWRERSNARSVKVELVVTFLK
jgi:hypothetical protein